MVYYILACVILTLLFVLLLIYVLSYRKRHTKSEGEIDETTTIILEKEEEHPLIEKRIESLVNEIREVTHSLWAALLTINGVIATVFSLFSINYLNQNWFVFVLSLATILCALSSSYLLIQNYILSRSWKEQDEASLNNYLETGRITKLDIRNILSPTTLSQIEFSEKYAIRLLYTEAILVTVVYIVSVLSHS